MMPDFSIEAQYEGLIAGVDEAGRGPWAGPVVAGAVIIDRDTITPDTLKLLNDSKKLSAKKREVAYEQLRDNPAIHWAVGLASAEEIDALNILQATFLAMKRAVSNLSSHPSVILVDGNRCPDFGPKAVPIIGGDSLSYSIAAASIIAKVTRDRIMETLAMDYPVYGWERNAGYGTKDHQEALIRNGVTPHHRQSYAPIRKLLSAA